MPKKKIKRSVSRRFKVTKTGKVLFAHQYSSHLKTRKSNSRIRRQKIAGVLSPAFAKKVKKMLGYL
ncbi:MAG TPA: 50S ribosomal protein L35 [Patescibacteria group bacterium]|nr:50S ribosomal protein L35 [Patescibacteria group bacterium]